MGSRYLNVLGETTKTHKELKDSAAWAFQTVGGAIYETPAGFRIVGGTQGTQMSFTASLSANIVIRLLKDNKYSMEVFLDWRWSDLLWILFVIGIIFAGIPWLVLLLYLFFDPSPVYSQVLYRITGQERME